MAQAIDMSANSAEIEADSPFPELRSGGVLAGLFFVGLLGWAAFVPLDAGAMAEGVVAVSGNRQAVQHRDGGIVTKLSVTEGQTVNEGDLLLQISASELVAAERGMSGEWAALLAQRERLRAERNNASAMIAPPEFKTLSADDKIIADEAMLGQRLLFQARQNSIKTERAVLEQRIRQHSEQIAGFEHQMRSNKTQQQILAEEIGGLKQLVPDGYVALNRVRNMEREAAELVGREGAFGADVARMTEAIGEAQMEIVSLERRRTEEVATQLRDVQVRIDDLQPKLISTKEQIARSTVRAPAGGRVVGLRVFTQGGVVAGGETLMEIVPQNKMLVIKGKASPTDADDLRLGMETQIRFPALQEKSIPIVHGNISKVSADSFEDERTGMRYFEIEVIAPQEELAKLKAVRADGGIRAGLPAEIMIPLRKRTALAYLLDPISSTIWKVGREN